MFDSLSPRNSRPLVLLKRATLLLVATFLIIGIVSAYRAWVQVRHLELKTSESALKDGSTVEAEVVNSGRATVDVHLELIQGTHTETLGTMKVRGNEFGFLDPRSKHAILTVFITNDVLTRFQSGEAQLRATATGGSQWGRVPPPVVREQRVEIAKL